MESSSEGNLVPKPNQGLVRLGKSSLMSRGRELATRQTEIEQVKGYRCVAWGRNHSGECDVPEGERFIQVSADSCSSAGVRPDGSVILWGDTYSQFPESERFVSIFSTLIYVYGLRSDGTVKPISKLLKAGDEDYESNYNDEFKHFPFTEKFVQISGGNECFLGLRSDGSVATWHTGEGNEQGHCDVPEDEKFTQIACAGNFAVGLRNDGSVRAWGRRAEKILFSSEDRFASVSGGGFFVVGIRSDGSFVVKGYVGFDSREIKGDLYKGSEVHWRKNDASLLLPDGSVIVVDFDGEILSPHSQTPPTDLKFSKLSVSNFHCLGLVKD